MPEINESLYYYLMQIIDSITHFLESGDFNYQIFDMGRKVTRLTTEQFEKFENQQAVYPYPFKRQARLALLFWSDHNKNKEPMIWFLHFPIDEFGYLQLDARDRFLLEVLEQAGKNILAKKTGESKIDQLHESSFAYKPTQDKQAIVNALAKKVLGLPPSRFYETVQDYIAGKLSLDQWQFLGLQGIADLVVNLDQDNNEFNLMNVISQMPAVPCGSFCNLLENIDLGDKLAGVIQARLQKELNHKDVNLAIVGMLIRALSGSGAARLRKQGLHLVLTSSVGGEIEILAAISGRSWEDLQDTGLMVLFLNHLAEHDQHVFDAVLQDLMLIPGMRAPVLMVYDTPALARVTKDRVDGFLKNLKDENKQN